VECIDGQVKVSGHVQSTVLYVAKGDPDFVAKAEVAEPGFEVVIPAPGVAVSDRAKADLILSQLEVESTGTRGLLLAATLTVSASALRDDVIDVAVSAEATGGSRISVYSEEISVASVSRSFSERVEFSETLSIPVEKGFAGAWIGMRSGGNSQGCWRPCCKRKVIVDGEIAVEIATAVPRGVPALSILRFERVPIHISFDALAPEKEVAARAKLSLSQLSVDVLSESEVRVYGAVDAEVDLVLSEYLSVVVDIDSETQEIVDTETMGIVVDRAVGEGSIDLDLEDSVALQSIMRHYPFTGMEDVSGSTGLLGLSDVDIVDDEVALRGSLQPGPSSAMWMRTMKGSSPSISHWISP